jgi:hypothetical protein
MISFGEVDQLTSATVSDVAFVTSGCSPSVKQEYAKTLEPRTRGDLAHNWRDFCEEYLGLGLTYLVDRIAAVAGIAKRYGSLLENSGYIAGVWEESIWQGLAWYIEDKHRKGRPASPVERPSWSWATMLGAVTFAHDRIGNNDMGETTESLHVNYGRNDGDEFLELK